MHEITVVGGGLAGLIAAIEAAEAGAPVRLLEARQRLGGRAATLPGDYLANLGPHAVYAGGSLWDWLVTRGLDRPWARPAPKALRLRWQGDLRRTPPAALLGLRRLYRHEAPIDRSFTDWVTDRAGPDAARALSGVAGVLTFDHDPGRVSAAFVWERMRRILLQPLPTARYLTGGWGAMVARLADRASGLGVTIETGAKVDTLGHLDTDPALVVLALEPGAARRLLGDDTLRPEAPKVALLDVGLVARRGDPYIVADLDEGAFVDRFTAVDPTLAPAGHSLVQASLGMRPGETLDAAEARIEAILDLSFDGWRERTTWRRRAAVTESTGALDLPGHTWRDRAPLQHATGVWLAGDWVAAPGHLAEVSCASAVQAAAGAVDAARIRAGLVASK